MILRAGGRRGCMGRWIGLLVAAAALTAGAPPAVAGPPPLEGNGMWIWYVSKSGGSAAAIAGRALEHDIGTVLIKSSDGTNRWSQFSRALVDELHAAGVQVCAWQFVYGTHPGEEAERGTGAARRGADCLVIDAESTYEGRYAAADRYVRRLRDLVGRQYPVALASFPYVDYHPAFPYSVFLGRRGAQANVPQMYWRAIGTTVRKVYAHTYRWNRPYDRTIFPLGQTWQNPPREQIIDFRKWAAGYGAAGVSWWSWQETQGAEWRWVGRQIASELAPSKLAYPLLGVGARGDVVVLLQELLRSAGPRTRIDGTFGLGTGRAVRDFQVEHGLNVTGTTTRATWRALGEYRPARVRWWARSRAAGTSRAAERPAAPASASLPAVRDEIPQTPGRP